MDNAQINQIFDNIYTAQNCLCNKTCLFLFNVNIYGFCWQVLKNEYSFVLFDRQP